MTKEDILNLLKLTKQENTDHKHRPDFYLQYLFLWMRNKFMFNFLQQSNFCDQIITSRFRKTVLGDNLDIKK